MLQLYFISVVLNGIIGFLFVFGDAEEKDSIEKSMKFSFLSGGFHLILGILTALTGFLKFLLPIKNSSGNTIYVFGDFIPAVAGIAAGFILLFGFYREHSANIDSENDLDRIGKTFLHNKKIIGFILIAVALLHFLFPTALLL